MDKPKKYLFDLNDFNEDVPVNTEEEEPLYGDEDLNAAREDAFRQGQQDATQKIRDEQEERVLQCTESLTRHLGDLIQAEQRREASKNYDTARLTLSIVKKMMPNLARNYAEEEITSLVKQTLSDQNEEPRLVVVVHDSLLETLRDKIDAIAESQAFQGKVVIIADDSLKPTDCRVEWADGGIEKDFDSLYRAIEGAFNTVIHRMDKAEFPAKSEQEQPETPTLTDNEKE